MKRRQFESLSVAVALAGMLGCGDHDFSGSWIGDVERMTVASGSSAIVPEGWQISESGDHVLRDRAGEMCKLRLEGGDWYPELILGQTCVLDGRSLILVDGAMNFYSPGGAAPELHWAASIELEPEVYEHGDLVQVYAGY